MPAPYLDKELKRFVFYSNPTLEMVFNDFNSNTYGVMLCYESLKSNTTVLVIPLYYQKFILILSFSVFVVINSKENSGSTGNILHCYIPGRLGYW